MAPDLMIKRVQLLFWISRIILSSPESDILRSISAFEHQFNIAFNPQRVFVSSFLSSRSDFTDALSKRLKLPVQVVDIVDEMQIQVNEETEELWNPVLMNNALALAVMASGRINGFNFYRESFANQKLWSKYGKQLILSAVLSGLVAGISLFDLFYETHHLNRRASAIDGEMIRTFKETLPQITRIVDPLHQMRTKLAEEKKAAQYFGETGSSMRLIDILSHISRLIPASIDLDMTRIVTGPGDVTISGNTDTFNTVNTIKTRLEHSDQFQRVAISSANMDKSGNRIRFKLKIDF